MSKQIMHFASTSERLKYLKGKFEEIIPQEVKDEPKVEEEKPKKAKKKGKKKDEVQAE